MTMADEKAAAGGAGRRAVEELVVSGGLDGLFEQIDAGQISLTGADGFLPALLEETLERGLQAELTDHLGYDKGERAPSARGNARNGTSTKTMDSEVGPFEIEVPRDRAGAFTPRLVRKGQRRTGRAGRHDHQPVRRRDDGARDPPPPGLHPGGGAERGDDQQHHRRRRRRRPAVAESPAGGVLTR